MVNDLSPTRAAAKDGQLTACLYCNAPVVFHPTVFSGHSLAFEARTWPAAYDRTHTGWFPGPFLLDGEIRNLHAPWDKHPAVRRGRVDRVLRLHGCTTGRERRSAA